MIERSRVPRSLFRGSWTRKTTFNAAYLVPIMVDEIYPGDHMKYSVSCYIRMSTPLFPIFDNQRVDTFFFYCPSRILWENWTKFMGEQRAAGDSINFTVPQVVSPVNGFAQNSIYDHFGLPCAGQTAVGSTISVNALPLRMYNLVFQEWFKDQDLQGNFFPLVNNGPDPSTNYALLRRGKSHDYFTTCRPWPQKFTAPTVALGGQAWVKGIGITDYAGANAPVIDGATYTEAGSAIPRAYAFSGAMAGFNVEANIAGGYPNVYADLSTATGVSINVLRQAFLVQQILERDARGGTRYKELIKAHFDVNVPDARLDRPEYIGGGSTPLVITPIAQTAPTAGVPLGALGAAGTAAGSHTASYAATEHGYVLGLINIRSELSYQQGIHKLWQRNTRFDFYFPDTAGLGEQAVFRRELFSTGQTATDDAVFGYQERWHELRTRVSEVTGKFRSTHTGTLDAWHLAERFMSAPVLGNTFIQDTPPMSRVLAAAGASADQEYLADIMFQREATRPLPMYGTPVTLGKF